MNQEPLAAAVSPIAKIELNDENGGLEIVTMVVYEPATASISVFRESGKKPFRMRLRITRRDGAVTANRTVAHDADEQAARLFVEALNRELPPGRRFKGATVMAKGVEKLVFMPESDGKALVQAPLEEEVTPVAGIAR